MKRVLYVDESFPAFVEMRATLRGLPGELELHYAPSTSQALENLASAPFDVVISNAAVSDPPAAEFLTLASQYCPSTLRIALDDDSDAQRSRALRAVCHLTLDARAPRAERGRGVGRALALAGEVFSARMIGLARNLDVLPAVPSLYFEFVRASNDPTKSAEDLGAIIQRDIALTARLLSVVNSAAFGLQHKLVDPGAAATYLGLELVKSLILSVQSFGQFADEKLKHFTVESVWRHSWRVAHFARAILECEHAERSVLDEAFLAGMLHDCGKLVLAHNRAERFEAARYFSERDGDERVRLETRLFGGSHAQLGAWLASRWGLPASVVEAIAFHHEPSRWRPSGMSALLAVHSANAFSRLDLDDASGRRIEGLDYDCLRRLGLSARLPAWLTACAAARKREDL